MSAQARAARNLVKSSGRVSYVVGHRFPPLGIAYYLEVRKRSGRSPYGGTAAFWWRAIAFHVLHLKIWPTKNSLNRRGIILKASSNSQFALSQVYRALSCAELRAKFTSQ
jgi:hypothetical protein